MGWELLLIGLGGLLGSGHCVGMCGGFAITLGLASSQWSRNLGRQLLYTAGRLCTYGFGGAVAGFGGWRLGQFSHGLEFQAGLSIIAGLLLAVQGLIALGWWPRWMGKSSTTPCRAQSLFSTLLRSPQWSAAFVAGLVTGFLPCGLVYANLALAASTGHLGAGFLVMMAFGLGTSPLMISTGLISGLLPVAWRSHLYRLAAISLLLCSGVTLYRGVMSWPGPNASDPEKCPFCAEVVEN